MSDPKATPNGEPVVEPVEHDGDVVERVNEALAEAEAAGREATENPAESSAHAEADAPVEAATSASGDSADESAAETSAEVAPHSFDEPATQKAPETPSEPVAAAGDDIPWYDRPLDETPGAAAEAEPAEAVVAPAPEPAPVTPVPVDSAPVHDAFVAGAAQPIFVQVPEPPRKRGNRGAAGLIGLLAAIVFAALSFGIIYGYGFLSGQVTSASASGDALDVIRSWAFWLPVVAFFLGFWLLGAVLNRARWPHWVIWGLLVGVVAYGGYLLGALFEARFWELTSREGLSMIDQQLFSPFAILSFVLGRELTIWFGAWVAARGKRVAALNDEAQREYERTLEAGPQLAQP